MLIVLDRLVSKTFVRSFVRSFSKKSNVFRKINGFVEYERDQTLPVYLLQIFSTNLLITFRHYK